MTNKNQIPSNGFIGDMTVGNYKAMIKEVLTPAGPTFEDGLIVGLLMARGSFTGDRHTPRITIFTGDVEMLQWVKSRIGGTISGPHRQPGGRVDNYSFHISGEPMRPVMELVAAYMPTGAQRTKYAAWVAKYWPAPTPTKTASK